MAISLDTFKQDRFRGQFPKLPGCLLLVNTHLFIKEDALKLCGWVDKSVFEQIENLKVERIKSKGKKQGSPIATDETVAGVPYIHAFNDKNEEGGLSFPNPRIHVLASSPRLVEVTDNGAKAMLGRKGQIIGNYEFPEGAAKHHEHDKELNLTTLRTIHMIMLVDQNNHPLHKIPLGLSVHGGAATIFGRQLETYYCQLEMAMTEYFGDSYYTLNEEARASAIFQPTFGVEAVGSNKTSDVCAVVDFIIPTAETVEKHMNLEYAEMLWNTRKSLGHFASRYLQQFQQFHALTPGVNLDAVPEQPRRLAAGADLYEDNFGEVEDDFQALKQRNLRRLEQDDPDNFVDF